MKISVYVTSLQRSVQQGVIVTASNGSPEGPPYVKWTVSFSEAEHISIGQGMTLEVTPHESTVT